MNNLFKFFIPTSKQQPEHEPIIPPPPPSPSSSLSVLVDAIDQKTTSSISLLPTPSVVRTLSPVPIEWSLPITFTSICTDSSSQQQHLCMRPPIPYLYRQLVLDFFQTLSFFLCRPITDVIHSHFFIHSTPSFDHEIVASLTFDSWFLSCSKTPFILERAWSLLVVVNPELYSYYSYIILSSDSFQRRKFAELCSLLYLDIRIETCTWQYSNPTNNPNIITLSKDELNQHESNKCKVFVYFTERQKLTIGSHHMLMSFISSSTLDYKDLYLNGYMSIITTLIAYDSTNPHPPPTVIDNPLSSNILDYRFSLLCMEQEASRNAKGTPMDYIIDEQDVINFILNKTNTKNSTRITTESIISNAYTRVLLAAAVGIRYNTRKRKIQGIHITESMSKRISTSLTNIQDRLCLSFIPLLLPKRIFIR